MSELEYCMVCPFCKREAIVLFSGSGKHGICMECGKELPEDKTYRDYEGRIISYTG